MAKKDNAILNRINSLIKDIQRNGHNGYQYAYFKVKIGDKFRFDLFYYQKSVKDC